MSTFNKNTLALAIVATLGFAANAAAYDLGTGAVTPGDDVPVIIAVPDATNPISLDVPPAGYTGEQLHVIIQPTDAILGRTTGFAVRLRLSDSSVATTGSPAPVTTGGVWAGGGPVITLNGAMAATWTATVATGVNTSEIIISVTPSVVVPAGVSVGNLFSLTNVVISGATVLNNHNGTIWAHSTIFDPVTTADILDRPSTPLIRALEPRVFGCDTTGRTNPSERIDVGQIVIPPGAGEGSKVRFSNDGSVGSPSNNTTRNSEFHAGFITYNLNGLVPGFSYLNTDVFHTHVTLTDYATLSAFAGGAGGSIFLSDPTVDPTNACAAPVSTFVTFSGNIAHDPAGYTLATPPLLAGGGFTTAVCMTVSNTNTTVLLESGITTTTSHRRAGGSFNSASAPCLLAPLEYNGSIVKVETFNQASNAVATGLLRVTNPSNLSGTVFIDAWDDAGVQRGPISFTLAAGASKQFNASQLEAGVAGLTGTLGTPTSGRWRFLVTGEFAAMRVVSFARNNSDNTLSNMTDYDTNDEQKSSNIVSPFSTYGGSDPN